MSSKVWDQITCKQTATRTICKCAAACRPAPNPTDTAPTPTPSSRSCNCPRTCNSSPHTKRSYSSSARSSRNPQTSRTSRCSAGCSESCGTCSRPDTGSPRAVRRLTAIPKDKYRGFHFGQFLLKLLHYSKYKIAQPIKTTEKNATRKFIERVRDDTVSNALLQNIYSTTREALGNALDIEAAYKASAVNWGQCKVCETQIENA